MGAAGNAAAPDPVFHGACNNFPAARDQGLAPIGNGFDLGKIFASGTRWWSDVMASSSDFANIPGMSKEMRDRVIAAFDRLSNWRDEVETVNERCLAKVLDETSGLARALGWRDQAVRATRDYMETASRAETEMIDQIMDGWKRQLKSSTAPMAVPRSFTAQLSGFSPSTFGSGMPEFNPLAPWMFWMQAAEMWQRTWMPEASSGRSTRSH